MKSIGDMLRSKQKRRNRRTDSNSKLRARRNLLEQLESRQLLAGDVFINELHYDNDGGDVGEFVEVAGPAGQSLAGWSIELYNGSNSQLYNTIALSGTIDDEGNGGGAVSFAQSGIQNGSPDALALIDDLGAVVEFLSYEGSLTAADGTAVGLTSTDIVVSEPSNTPIGQSLQLTGTGDAASDFVWNAPAAESPGSLNVGQTYTGTVGATTVSIAPDNAVQAEGDASTTPFTFTVSRFGDTSGTSSVDYAVVNGDTNGTDFSGSTSGTVNFLATETSQTVTIDVSGDLTQESNEDFSVVLSNPTDAVIGNASADGTIQDDDTPLSTAVINEFVVNHTGIDINEFIEIRGGANEDLSSYSVLVIDGDGGASGNVNNIFMLGTNSADGYQLAGGAIINNQLQNGSQTLLLVKDSTATLGQDLDTDDDGTLDLTPWSASIDDVGILDGGLADNAYTTSALTASTMNDGNTFAPGGASRIPDGTDTDTAADWLRNAFSGEGLPGFVAGGAVNNGEAINTPAGELNPLDEFFFGNHTGDNDVIAPGFPPNPPLPLSPALTPIESDGSTDVSESGQQDTFEIALTTNPSSAVTVTVTPDSQIDLGSGVGVAVVLNFVNKLPQAITVTADDDMLLEAAIHTGLISISSSSSDSDYNGINTSVTANIADNETPAPSAFLNEFVINHTGTDVDEFVEVRTTPGAILSTLSLINIDGDVSFQADIGEILNVTTLGTADGNGFFVAPQTTPEIFGGPNLVLVEGFTGGIGIDVDVNDDGVFDWEEAVVPVGGLTSAPWFSIRDAVSVPGTGDASYGFVELSPAGLADGNPFEVGGASRIPDAGAATTSASEWVRNDFEGGGLPNYPFDTDPSTPGTALNTPGALNSVLAGLIVEQSNGSTAAEENGAGDTLVVSLGGPTPVSDVTVTITPDAQLDLGNGAGVAVVQVFTAPSQGPIGIAVEAVDDAVAEGPHSGLISFSFSSADPNYSSGLAPDVTVSITDDETPTPNVMITELMYNPNGAEPAGEWIEIVNVGAAAVDLTGWTFDDEDASDWSAFPSVTLDPGEIGVVFNSTVTSGQFATGWGVPAGVELIGVTWGSLSNGANSANEILELLDDSGNQIDLVNYEVGGDWPGNTGGLSIYLTDLSTDNNIGTNWAQSDVDPNAVNPTGTTFDNTDEGSPGAIPGLPTGVSISIDGASDGGEAGPIDGKFIITQSGISGTDTVISYTATGSATEGTDYASLSGTVTIFAGNVTNDIDIDVSDDPTFEGTETVTITIDSATPGTVTVGTASSSIDITDDETPPSFNAGDVVINEIMKNPSDVGDSDGEYFEIFNTTGSAIDLTGWTISDNDTDSHTISGAPLVPANSYYVLGINSDTGTNNGITVDYEYTGITLSNGDDELVLTDAANNEIDRVEYTTADFPNAAGSSLELLPAILGNANPEVDNDLGSNWQSSTTAIGAGSDLGTPGAVNSAPAPEINVTGLAETIFDGDLFPSALDGTDFGPVQIGSPTVSQFLIENTGAADLDVSAISISGLDAADFSISNITLPAVISPGNSVTFDVTFNPTTAGTKTATVEITNTDVDEGIYDFAIQGDAVVGVAPEILVESSFIEIVDGDVTPDLADNTDYGSVDVASGSIGSETYFIENNGTADLNITGITFTGAASGDFTLDATSITLPAVIAPGGNASFTVDFDPSATGARDAIVNIANDDADENPYDFAITGNGVNAATTVLINEVDADTPGTDAAEFIELFGPGGTSLDGLSVVLYNGSDDASYDVIDLDGQTIPGDGYFVIGSGTVPNVDMVEFTTNGVQNGADAVALVVGNASEYPNDTPVGSTNLVDAVVYDTNDGDDAVLLAGLGESTQFNEGEGLGGSATDSNSRVPNGADASPFVAQAPTPGANNEGGGDTTPPVVTDVIVSSVGSSFAWGPTFIDEVDGGGVGAGNGLGYSVVGTTRTVPWYTVNTIYVQFSEDVIFGGFDLFGVNVADYAGSYSISHSGDLTTITMTSPFGLPEADLGPPTTGIDKLLLQLSDGAITDLSGNILDGDGIGGAGGEFTQRFDVLPGDGTGDGAVNNVDVGLTNLRGFLSIANPGPNGFGFSYDAFFDLTGDGVINNVDVGLTNFQGFDTLPAGEPVGGGGGGGAGAAQSADDDDDWAELVDQALAGGLF